MNNSETGKCNKKLILDAIKFKVFVCSLVDVTNKEINSSIIKHTLNKMTFLNVER